jgi:hypothetical protein
MTFLQHEKLNREDLIPQKHGGEKTKRFSKPTKPIRFLDSSNCAKISSE